VFRIFDFGENVFAKILHFFWPSEMPKRHEMYILKLFLETWRWPIDSNGDYNLLLSKIFKIFDYFCILRFKSSIFESFSWIRVSHLLPHLFREIFANTKIPNKFRIKFEYGKKSVSSFAKHKNTEKVFCIALSKTY